MVGAARSESASYVELGPSACALLPAPPKDYELVDIDIRTLAVHMSECRKVLRPTYRLHLAIEGGCAMMRSRIVTAVCMGLALGTGLGWALSSLD